jgi:hypothetical protein
MFTATVPSSLPTSPAFDNAQSRALLNQAVLTRTVADPYRISEIWSLGGSAQGGGGNNRYSRPSRAGYTANLPAGARAMAV